MSEPVGIRKAAAALGVDRGTVYRYVRKGWLANRGTPAHPLVILEEARAAGVGLWGRGRRLRLAGGEAVDAEPADQGAEPANPTANYSEPMRGGAAAESPSAPAGAELVGVNEAGRRLGIDPGQISRQIKAGIIPNRGGADRPLVNVDEARQARAVGLDRSKQRGPGAPLFAAPVGPSSAQADNETYQSARARREAVAAQMAELDLLQRKGGLMLVEAAERCWGEELSNLIAAVEQFIIDLPPKLGLGRDAVDLCRREWRTFRQRQADQARALGNGADPAATDRENPFSGPPAHESASLY